RLRAHDLAEISAEGRVFMFQGGTSGADLTRASISQTRDEMIDAGAISATEIERDLLQLDKPDFMMPSPIMWAVRGRRRMGGQERQGRGHATAPPPISAPARARPRPAR